MDYNDMNGRELFYLEQLHIDKTDGIQAEAEEFLRKSDEAIFERYPVETMGAEIRRRLESGRKERSLFTPGHMVPLLAAAALTIMIGIAAFYPSLTGSPVPGTERIKGMDPVLSVFRAEGESVNLLDERDRARAFDLLQLEYNGAGYPYGIIFSIDGRGVITLHYPASPAVVPQLDPGAVLLPYSYQLDDAPDFERFFFVTSRERFAPEEVLEAARKLTESEGRGRLELPKHFNQSTLTILKEEME